MLSDLTETLPKCFFLIKSKSPFFIPHSFFRQTAYPTHTCFSAVDIALITFDTCPSFEFESSNLSREFKKDTGTLVFLHISSLFLPFTQYQSYHGILSPRKSSPPVLGHLQHSQPRPLQRHAGFTPTQIPAVDRREVYSSSTTSTSTVSRRISLDA